MLIINIHTEDKKLMLVDVIIRIILYSILWWAYIFFDRYIYEWSWQTVDHL